MTAPTRDTKKQVTFKLEKKTLELLAFTAKASGCTQASIVDDALREYLGDASESETLDSSLALIAHEAEKSRRRLAALAQYAEDQKREKEQEQEQQQALCEKTRAAKQEADSQKQIEAAAQETCGGEPKLITSAAASRGEA